MAEELITGRDPQRGPTNVAPVHHKSSLTVRFSDMTNRSLRLGKKTGSRGRDPRRGPTNVTIGPSCSGINLKVNLRGKMVGSTAETTVNRGETIKDREKARSEARGGSETDKGEVEGQEGNKYIVKRVEFGS